MGELREALRQVLCEQVELGCDLRTEQPADRGDRSEQQERHRYDSPVFRDSRAAAYLMRNAAQQQGQKSGTERQHQHVGKFPNRKGCRSCINRHFSIDSDQLRLIRRGYSSFCQRAKL